MHFNSFKSIFNLFIIISILFWLYKFLQYIRLFHKINEYCYYIEHNYWVLLLIKLSLIPLSILGFILAYAKNFEYNDSLIFLEGSKMHNVYAFVIAVVMVLSIDIASVQFLNTSLNKSHSYKMMYYLGVNKLRFLLNPYLNIHKFIRNDVFYVLLFYFLMAPMLIFNYKFIKNYSTLDLNLLSFWQIITVIILFVLFLLIVFDFKAFKYTNLIKYHNIQIMDKINNSMLICMRFELAHDFVYNDRSFTNGLISKFAYDKLSILDKKILIELSIRTFLNHILDKHIIHFNRMHDISSYYSLIEYYLKFLNRNRTLIDNRMIIRFLNGNPGYLDISNHLHHRFKNEYINMFVSFYQKGAFNLLINRNMKSDIIPDFVFNKTKSYEYWETINDIISNSDFMYNMLNYTQIKDLQHFNYDPNGYRNDKRFAFIQKILENLIDCEMSVLDSTYNQNNEYTELLESMEWDFTRFIYSYFHSKYFDINIGDMLSDGFRKLLNKKLLKR